MATQAESGHIEGGAPPQARPSFLRVLAHELRNHIATINNTVYMLRLQAGTASASGGAPPAMLDMIERQAAAMTRVIDVIVEAERLQRGELTLSMDPVDLRKVVSDAAAATEGLRATRRQAFSVAGTGARAEIRGDARRLTDALTNVLDNATRYSKDGSTIGLDVSTTPERVVIRVRDEGMGIAAERLPGLFEFLAARGHGAGLGLGLPLARAWLELHDASIEVRSPGKDQGTEVVIGLPLAGATRAAVAPASVSGNEVNPDAAARVVRRVLVVDDHASLRSSLSTALQEMGHVTREAASGDQALESVDAWNPEFVLLDIHMPGMSGFEVARKLRNRYPGSSMQLVMMSGDTLDEFVVAGAREAGFDHWVDKTQALEGLHAILGAGAPTA